MPTIPALGVWQQGSGEFEASMACIKQTNKQKWQKTIFWYQVHMGLECSILPGIWPLSKASQRHARSCTQLEAHAPCLGEPDRWTAVHFPRSRHQTPVGKGAEDH